MLYTLTAVRPSRAFHDAVCEYRGMFTIFSTVAYRTWHVQKQVAGEVSWHQAPSVVVARVYTCGMCGRYPVSIDLSAEEGKKEPKF